METRSFLKGEKMYIRKTEDVYGVYSQYGLECNCEDLKDAKDTLKCYRENVNYPVWIEKHRVKKEDK